MWARHGLGGHTAATHAAGRRNKSGVQRPRHNISPERHACATMRPRRFFALSVVASAAAASSAAAGAVSSRSVLCDFFVSGAHGSDSNAGTSVDAPFRTVAHAVTAPRPTAGGGGGRTVCLRSETFHLPATLAITSAESSSADALTITAYPADLAAGRPRPVLSGGVLAGPFAAPAVAGAPWTAPAPAGTAAAPSEVLFLAGPQGGWLQRARMPTRQPADEASRHMGTASTFQYAGPLEPPTAARFGSGRDRRGGDGDGSGATATAGAGEQWPDKDRWGFRVDDASLPAGFDLSAEDGAQVLTFQAWTAFWSDVAVLNRTNASLMFQAPLRNFIGQWAVPGGRRFIIENVRRGLDEPGEWYWERPAPSGTGTGTASAASDGDGQLLLLPPPSTNTSEPLFAVVPRLASVVSVQGGADGFVLQDVEVRHAATGGIVNVYYSSTAAVVVQNASRTTLRRVRVSDTGATGVLAAREVAGLNVLDCAVERTGGDGVAVGTADPTSVRDAMVDNCLVNDTARVVLGQPGGIRAKGAANVSVTGNTVGFCPYAGIMLGWQSGVNRSAGGAGKAVTDPILTAANNYVHDFGLGILSDFAGIYASTSDNLCFQRVPETCWLPTHVYGNVVVRGTHFNYGGNGLYLDEQISGVLFENNTVDAVGGAGVYFHCGGDNAFRNNIVLRAGQQQDALSPKLLPGMCNAGGNPTWPNMGDAIGFQFDRNVVLVGNESASTHSAYGFSDFRNASFDNNVYWAANSSSAAALQNAAVWPGKTAPSTWAAWQALGQDARSVVADPLFEDWAALDLRLKPGSPALARGFVQFQDHSKAGCSPATNPYCV